MIRYADSAALFAAGLAPFPLDDPFVCRVLSLCRSYPPPFCSTDYWLIEDGKGVCGAVARHGSAFTAVLTERCDAQEVSAFLQMAGARSVLCDGEFALTGFSSATEGVVMQRTEPLSESRGEYTIRTPDLRAVHALLTQCQGEGFTPPAFEDFYVDVNHQLRHSTMRLCGIDTEGQLAAVAMIVAESETCAVLGAVACHPALRRRGYGAAAVSHLTNQLIAEGKTVTLHRALNANVAFYRSLGFSECGRWREYQYE